MIIHQNKKDKTMTLKNYVLEVLKKGEALTVAQIAEIIIADERNTFSLPQLKKTISIATIKWSCFKREKSDGKIHVSLDTLTQQKALNRKIPTVQDISELR